MAALFVVSALGFNAKAQQTPEAGKTYYLYNPTTERFLSRGSGFGTAAWADNFGIPVTLIANGEGFRLQMFDSPGQYVSDAYGHMLMEEKIELKHTDFKYKMKQIKFIN